MKLLLVDDHAVVRSGLARLLRAGGWQLIAEASNASEALAQARAGDWDLVVIDLLLGAEDGLELVQRLRQLYPRLALMILSMHSHPRAVRQAVRLGVQAFVMKDASPQEVVAATLAARHRCFYLDARVAPGFLRGDDLKNQHSALLEGLRQGLSNQQLAESTHLSLSSVKAELRALFQEYGVKDRHGLAKVLNLKL